MAKLIWGVWGGVVVFKAEAAGRWGNGFVGLVRMPCFRGLFFSAKRPVEAKVDVSRFLGLCQALKYCNLQYFYVFGMEKDEKVFLLQRAEHCVNTSVLARHWPKNAVNTVTFATRGTKHRK